MGSLIARGSKLYAKLKTADGSWKRIATGYDDTADGRRDAAEMLADLEHRADTERAAMANGSPPTRDLTVRRWAALWRDDRAKLGKDAKHEHARLEHHVLPVIGDMLIANVRTPTLIDLFKRIRTTPSRETGEPLSPRTVHNVYGVLALVLRDAVLAGVIDHAPAALDERHLGRKVDRDPEWRDLAIFTRDEVQAMISSLKIPVDRRVVYAIELLAGTRPSEAAALRWRNYDAAKRPLGELRVAHSYSAKLDRVKGTKTDAVKHVPVHPTLAAILAEWKLHGWAAMMGREPTPDDLIVPLPPADAEARTTKTGEPFRPDYYSRRRWVEEDLPALGWRHRRHYDTRATFITLALEDGADREIIEARVTHTRPNRTAFDMYNRGLQWERTCSEVAKLKITRVRDPQNNVIRLPLAAIANGGTTRDDSTGPNALGPIVVQSRKSPMLSVDSGLRRRASNPRPGG